MLQVCQTIFINLYKQIASFLFYNINEYFIDEETSDEITPEVAFGCHLFTILLYNLTSIIQNTREQRQHPWVSIYGAARDVIRYKNLVFIFNIF